MGAIVGGVLGTLAVIVAAGMAYWFCWRPRRAGRQGQPGGQAGSAPAGQAWRPSWRPPSHLVPRALRRQGGSAGASTEGADASATVVVVRSGSLKAEAKLGDGGAVAAGAEEPTATQA